MKVVQDYKEKFVSNNHLDFQVKMDSQSMQDDIKRHIINLSRQTYNYGERLDKVVTLYLQHLKNLSPDVASKCAAAILKHWQGKQSPSTDTAKIDELQDYDESNEYHSSAGEEEAI